MDLVTGKITINKVIKKIKFSEQCDLYIGKTYA